MRLVAGPGADDEGRGESGGGGTRRPVGAGAPGRWCGSGGQDVGLAVTDGNKCVLMRCV